MIETLNGKHDRLILLDLIAMTGRAAPLDRPQRIHLIQAMR